MEANSGGGPANSSDFVRKLYKMLETPSDENVVRWGNEGDSFVVLENEKFTKHILPKHFKHSNFASFVRQLNKYDFHKVRHNNEDSGQSPYGPGAWEFKHPDFKMNNKDALDNIRRKAPAARKPNTATDELMIPTQQIDMLNSQLGATQQQLQHLTEKNNELSIQNSMMIQELIGLQKTVVNHEQILHNVVNFLNDFEARRRRDSRSVFASTSDGGPSATLGATQPPLQSADNDDSPPSPLQHASKLLSETNVDVMLNNRNLEHMNEMSLRMNGGLITTPPPDLNHRNGGRPSTGSAPHSAGSSGSMRFSELDTLVYPVGQNNGIDPMYSEHIHNIPYSTPVKQPESGGQVRAVGDKKSGTLDPGWVRKPHILLVEDDVTCRRIGTKFLLAFSCSVTTALDGLEAVNKMNEGHKFDLILMDIIMPNLDGVSACHLIRQFDRTPIIAMTSNIRSDDIAMYFSHGMNDVLPKPFTKEGLLAMLEKHLEILKRGDRTLESMGQSTAQPAQAMIPHIGSGRQSIKDEESPAKSPATTSTWNSPNQIPGVSPVTSSHTDDYMNVVQGHPAAYGMAYTSPQHLHAQQMQMPPGQMQGQLAGQGHRRQLSDISGGAETAGDGKRQQIYAPSMQPLGALQRPR